MLRWSNVESLEHTPISSVCAYRPLTKIRGMGVEKIVQNPDFWLGWVFKHHVKTAPRTLLDTAPGSSRSKLAKNDAFSARASKIVASDFWKSADFRKMDGEFPFMRVCRTVSGRRLDIRVGVRSPMAGLRSPMAGLRSRMAGLRSPMARVEGF